VTSTEGPLSLEKKATDGPKTDVTESPAGEQQESSTEAETKLKKKALKRLEDDRRPLDSWERYRALNDAMDEAYELIDIANREARFSLILMGALNVVLFVVGTRTDMVQSLPVGLRPWIAVLLVLYAFVALYFFLQAIETLRPRRFRPRLQGPKEEDLEDCSIGVRYYEDIIGRNAESYWKAWREIRIGQLNAELASQVHSLAFKNRAKYEALKRLYAGLRLMALLVAILLMLIGYFTLGSSGKAVPDSSLIIAQPEIRGQATQSPNSCEIEIAILNRSLGIRSLSRISSK
jgi:hypothetical protein